MWLVVEFTLDDLVQVDVVPKCWVKMVNSAIVWPPNIMTDTSRRKAVASASLPTNDWTQYPIRILHTEGVPLLSHNINKK